MMLRKLLVFVVCIGLVGCGSGGKSIVGTWESGFKGSTLTLQANPDSSFSISGSSTMSGRWESVGSEIHLFRDIRNGGDQAFGTGGDGSIHFQLSQDGQSLTGKSGDGTPFTFTKK